MDPDSGPQIRQIQLLPAVRGHQLLLAAGLSSDNLSTSYAVDELTGRLRNGLASGLVRPFFWFFAD